MSAGDRLQRSTWPKRCLGDDEKSSWKGLELYEITTFGVAGGLKTILKSLHGYADMVWRPFLSVGRELERTLEATGSPTGRPAECLPPRPPPHQDGVRGRPKIDNLLLAELDWQLFWQTAECWH